MIPYDAESGFYYLATPYSKFPGGKEEAFRLACLAAAQCYAEGILVFSPIAHTHCIAVIGGLDGSYQQWQIFNEVMLRASLGMIVVEMEGWDVSDGIEAETVWCTENKKPITFRPSPLIPSETHDE
jgi:hypothetical protein